MTRWFTITMGTATVGYIAGALLGGVGVGFCAAFAIFAISGLAKAIVDVVEFWRWWKTQP